MIVAIERDADLEAILAYRGFKQAHASPGRIMRGVVEVEPYDAVRVDVIAENKDEARRKIRYWQFQQEDGLLDMGHINDKLLFGSNEAADEFYRVSHAGLLPANTRKAEELFLSFEDKMDEHYSGCNAQFRALDLSYNWNMGINALFILGLSCYFASETSSDEAAVLFLVGSLGFGYGQINYIRGKYAKSTRELVEKWKNKIMGNDEVMHWFRQLKSGVDSD